MKAPRPEKNQKGTRVTNPLYTQTLKEIWTPKEISK